MNLKKLSSLINEEIKRYNKRLIKFFEKDDDFSKVKVESDILFNREEISFLFNNLKFNLKFVEFPHAEKSDKKINFHIQLEVNDIILSKDGYIYIVVYEEPEKTYIAIKKTILEKYKKFKIVDIIDKFSIGFTPYELISNISLFLCHYIEGDIINFEEYKNKIKINFKHKNRKGYLIFDRKKEKVLISLNGKVVLNSRSFYVIDIEDIFNHIKSSIK